MGTVMASLETLKLSATFVVIELVVVSVEVSTEDVCCALVTKEKHIKISVNIMILW